MKLESQAIFQAKIILLNCAPDFHLTEGPPGGPPSFPRALSPVAVQLVREFVDAAEPDRNLNQTRYFNYTLVWNCKCNS